MPHERLLTKLKTHGHREDPFPETLEKMQREAIQGEQVRLGRPLSDAEVRRLLDDEPMVPQPSSPVWLPEQTL